MPAKSIDEGLKIPKSANRLSRFALFGIYLRLKNCEISYSLLPSSKF